MKVGRDVDTKKDKAKTYTEMLTFWQQESVTILGDDGCESRGRALSFGRTRDFYRKHILRRQRPVADRSSRKLDTQRDGLKPEGKQVEGDA
uniref:Transposase n=1 Tax=Steinernema glaseri TaxID=37863 RepID=A0A1I7Z5G9_9BILA